MPKFLLLRGATKRVSPTCSGVKLKPDPRCSRWDSLSDNWTDRLVERAELVRLVMRASA